MTSNWELGDKAIIVKSNAGNEGKIVVVTGVMDSNEFNGQIWLEDHTIIVRSLGSPLSTTTGNTSMEAPAAPANLRKLPKLTEPELEFEESK